MTVIDYKGYRIEVRPLGRGWRASIFSPGSTTPWPNSPVNLEKSSTEEIVAEAKRIIEVRLGPRLQHHTKIATASPMTRTIRSVQRHKGKQCPQADYAPSRLWLLCLQRGVLRGALSSSASWAELA